MQQAKQLLMQSQQQRLALAISQLKTLSLTASLSHKF
jgi:hypothetical protein